MATVQVDVGDCPGRAPQFTLMTTTMHEVKIYPCVVEVAGEAPSMDASQVNDLIDEVNVIYRQVGMHFSLGAPLKHVTNDIWACDGLVNRAVGAQIRNITNDTGGVEVYFIHGDGNREDEPLGSYNSHGIIVRRPFSAVAIAHEIGHACKWADVYAGKEGSAPTELYEGLHENRMPNDWNNGTGCRYYDQSLTQRDIIARLLMNGVKADGQADIPLGGVFGKAKDGGLGIVNVGRTGLFTASPHSN